MAIQGTDLYVGGNLLNKLSTVGSGSIDPSWNPNPTSTNGFVLIKSILLSGTNVFVSGIFDSIGGVNRAALAKLSAQTGLADPTWGVSFGATSQSGISVHSMAISGTNLFVGGDFQQIGGLNIKYAAKLAITGSGAVDPNWNPNPYSLVTAPIVASSNYVYISGVQSMQRMRVGKTVQSQHLGDRRARSLVACGGAAGRLREFHLRSAPDRILAPGWERHGHD